MSTSDPLVLGIETSCDETGVGIVRGGTLLVDAVASSVDEHARFGGVVPEVASRAHLEAMVPTIERACAQAHHGRREPVVGGVARADDAQALRFQRVNREVADGFQLQHGAFLAKRRMTANTNPAILGAS